MKNNVKRKISTVIILLFLGMSIAPSISIICAEEQNFENDNTTINFCQEFSDPIIDNNEESVSIHISEANSVMNNQGGPKLPIFTKTFEFPWGTQITDINYQFSDVKTISLTEKIESVPFFTAQSNVEVTVDKKESQITYESQDPYPLEWISFNKGSGINKNSEHVLFLTVRVSPVKHIPSEDIIQYINNVDLEIHYEKPIATLNEPDIYDLVIIAPLEYADELLPLVEHKESFGMKTNLTTLDYIYSSFPGRDEPEKIKYFIKYALEEWGIDYVLLIGSIDKLPIRKTLAYPWDDCGPWILADLYYGDIYNETSAFCSWDGNENDTFGEVEYEYGWPPNMIDYDGVDLYPDVHVGRLACRNIDEVNTVVNKIIYYEKNTYGQRWFKRIILAGGDTFPPFKGSPFFIYEGEITNKEVAKHLPNFRHIKLWATRRNLNAITFNMKINRGAGFLTYAGHGFDVTWGTYRPNSLSKRQIGYDMMLLYLLRNQHKLPIVFFDACLTARLDFNMDLFSRRYPILNSLFENISGIRYNKSDLSPCFAWKFITMKRGGSIATIGATRSAYTWVDRSGVHAGAGYLDVAFFKAYEEGKTLGEMFSEAQIDYLNNVGMDYFTIEDFILLGDPSLMVGGYPK